MSCGVYEDKMLLMLHASDDDLPVAPAHAHPHSRAVISSPRPDGARRGPLPHTLTSWGGEVVVDAMVPAHSRAGRRWSSLF
jgi:hypothetical protein